MSSSSDSDSDPDAPPPPPGAECQRRIEAFLAVAGGDADGGEAYAQMLLQRSAWSVEAALDRHFVKQAKKSGVEVKASTRAPEKLRIISWNIDGLDDRSREARTEAVCRTIEERQADVVFLQEVVPETLPLIKDRLPRYQVIPQVDQESGPQRKDAYFTAVLLKRFCVYLDSFETTPFPGSLMGRALQRVECHVGRARLLLLNSHLESTRECSGERQAQLRECFSRALSAPASAAVLLGGDLNLRDAELRSVGGPPAGMEDLWEAGGSRKECAYTWDMGRNTNLEFPGRSKPRCRFDRLYFRDCEEKPGQVRLTHFGLVGLERVPGTTRFPSDHWGIEATLKVESNK